MWRRLKEECLRHVDPGGAISKDSAHEGRTARTVEETRRGVGCKTEKENGLDDWDGKRDEEEEEEGDEQEDGRQQA